MNDFRWLIDRLRNAAGGDLGRKMCASAADVIESLQSKCEAQAKYIEALQGKCEAQDEYIEALQGKCDALTKQSASNRRLAERTYDSAMRKLKANDETIAGLHRDRAVLQHKIDVLLADLKKNWICFSCKKRIPKKEWFSCKDIDTEYDEDGCITCRNYDWRGPREDKASD